MTHADISCGEAPVNGLESESHVLILLLDHSCCQSLSMMSESLWLERIHLLKGCTYIGCGKFFFWLFFSSSPLLLSWTGEAVSWTLTLRDSERVSVGEASERSLAMVAAW